MNVDDVKKYVELTKEVVQIVVVLLPDGKIKDKVKKVSDLLEKDVVVEAVVVGFKLKDELVELLK